MAYQKLQGRRAAAVTPSDTANIPSISSEDGSGNNGCVLYVGSFGDVKVRTIGGDDVTFKNVQAGTFLPVQVIRVFSTGTTSTDIVALW
jgi:hypothetical protein